MQMSIGLDRLKRFVCLLLIFVLLFCFFMCPRASAVAVEAATVAYASALVGTILVGAGVIFSSHGDMQKVGAAMYKSWVNSSNAIGSKISAIAAWAVEHGEAAAKGALRVGKEMYQAIVDAFNAAYSNGEFDTSEVASTAYSSFVEAYPVAKDFWFRAPWVSYWSDFDFASGEADTIYHIVFRVDSDSYSGSLYRYWNGSEYRLQSTGSGSGLTSSILSFRLLNVDGYFGYEIKTGDGGTYGSKKICKLDCATDFSFSRPGSGVVVSAPDLAYPSDDYLVKMPDIPTVDTATGEATFPTDAAYTKDAVAVPYPVDADGVKVPDIPYDKVVDQSTGKTLDDTDTGTDTGTDTDNPSKPGEDTDTDNPSDSVNWPSASDLSLPQLIISKFPFCIPFDVIRLIGMLDAEPKAPVFKLPIKYATVMNEELTLDVSQWDDVIKIVRWGELVVFVAALVYVTRNYIKW